MVEKPFGGWSSFDFDESAIISYIDYFPYDILAEIIDSYKNNHAFCVTYDAEGYEYSILSHDLLEVEFILRKEENPEIKKLEKSFGVFVDEIIKDVENDLETWAIFPVSFDEEDIKIQVKELKDLIAGAKEVSKNLWHGQEEER